MKTISIISIVIVITILLFSNYLVMKTISIIPIVTVITILLSSLCSAGENPGPCPCKAGDQSLNYIPSFITDSVKFKNDIYSNTANLLCLW